MKCGPCGGGGGGGESRQHRPAFASPGTEIITGLQEKPHSRTVGASLIFAGRSPSGSGAKFTRGTTGPKPRPRSGRNGMIRNLLKNSFGCRYGLGQGASGARLRRISAVSGGKGPVSRVCSGANGVFETASCHPGREPQRARSAKGKGGGRLSRPAPACASGASIVSRACANRAAAPPNGAMRSRPTRAGRLRR